MADLVTPVEGDLNKYMGNIILDSIRITDEMQAETNKFANSAKERKKDLEATLKNTNMAVCNKQREIGNHYSQMAYISVMIMVVGVASNVGSTVMSASGSSQQAANLLGSIGNNISNSGSQVASNFSQSRVNMDQGDIEAKRNEAMKIRDSETQDKEKDKQRMDELKSKMDQGVTSAMEKLSMAYSHRG